MSETEIVKRCSYFTSHIPTSRLLINGPRPYVMHVYLKYDVDIIQNYALEERGDTPSPFRQFLHLQCCHTVSPTVLAQTFFTEQTSSPPQTLDQFVYFWTAELTDLLNITQPVLLPHCTHINPLNKDTSKRRQFNVFVVRSKDVHRGARMKVFATSFLDVFLEFSINVQMT